MKIFEVNFLQLLIVKFQMMEQPRTAVGSRVLVPHKNIQGTVSYIGELRGRIGQWVGLTLDSPIGLNNGSVDNIEYFKVRTIHNAF